MRGPRLRSAAVVPSAPAHTANAMLYLFFATNARATACRGARRKARDDGLHGGVLLYLAAYIAPDPRVLYSAASLGGFAGALLWTAQGAYFTRNAVEYAACDPADSTRRRSPCRHLRHRLPDLPLAKPLAGALLAARRHPASVRGVHRARRRVHAADGGGAAAAPPAACGRWRRRARIRSGGSLLAMLIERMLLLAANNAV